MKTILTAILIFTFKISKSQINISNLNLIYKVNLEINKINLNLINIIYTDNIYIKKSGLGFMINEDKSFAINAGEILFHKKNLREIYCGFVFKNQNKLLVDFGIFNSGIYINSWFRKKIFAEKEIYFSIDLNTDQISGVGLSYNVTATRILKTELYSILGYNLKNNSFGFQIGINLFEFNNNDYYY
jgi:hypothetical protein